MYQFEYFNDKGERVESATDPEWAYTVLNGRIRTRKKGPPQYLVEGKWVDIPKK